MVDRLMQPLSGECELRADEASLTDDLLRSHDTNPAESQRRLHKLYELSREVCATRGRTAVLQRAAEAVVQLTGAERCFILLGDKVGHLNCVMAHPVKPFRNDEKWPISRTILDRVLESRQSLLTSDALVEFNAVPSVTEHNIRSVLCVVIGPAESPVGTIYADNLARQGVFNKLDLWFLTALAQFIYVSYCNARDLELIAARCEMYQDDLFRSHQIVGRSQVMLQSYELLRRAARKELPILLLGESGTGKELFAAAAHRLSSRSAQPFVPVNIAGLSRELISSELFGHKKGAFTGAAQDRKGRLELSDGGTLFLDEVGEIPLDIQAMLLRALETKMIEPAGSNETIHANFRLVCATNRDLSALIKEGRFREDLYYRIKGVVIELPPLRRRADDIPALVQEKLQALGSSKRFNPAALKRLQQYPWCGNVRELYRFVEAMDALCPLDEIDEPDLPAAIRNTHDTGAEPQSTANDLAPLQAAVERFEREHFRRALSQAGGKDQEAMKLLGLKRATYFEKKRKLLSQPD